MTAEPALLDRLLELNLRYIGGSPHNGMRVAAKLVALLPQIIAALEYWRPPPGNFGGYVPWATIPQEPKDDTQ